MHAFAPNSHQGDRTRSARIRTEAARRQGTRLEGDFGRADTAAQQSSLSHFLDEEERLQVLRSQARLLPPCTDLHDTDGLTEQCGINACHAQDLAATFQHRAVDLHWRSGSARGSKRSSSGRVANASPPRHRHAASTRHIASGGAGAGQRGGGHAPVVEGGVRPDEEARRDERRGSRKAAAERGAQCAAARAVRTEGHAEGEQEEGGTAW